MWNIIISNREFQKTVKFMKMADMKSGKGNVRLNITKPGSSNFSKKASPTQLLNHVESKLMNKECSGPLLGPNVCEVKV